MDERTKVQIRDAARRRLEALDDHDRLIEVGVTLAIVAADVSGLPCKSNNPAVDPMARIKSLEDKVGGLGSTAIKAGGGAGVAGGGLMALLWQVLSKMFGGP